ncbi:hypothetical protein DAEQUDRAFT_722629 [Daedalea quercina L-15889]|uniref:Uncharacterized protein n=1 Tax=Daedalea quercina L-15889 TaxID=1314783 RepID=A0A165STW8_9APHY|nr:hypothetical protein DAEQUDRAFT_722629 [Daedalea quercina L-15889]
MPVGSVVRSRLHLGGLWWTISFDNSRHPHVPSGTELLYLSSQAVQTQQLPLLLLFFLSTSEAQPLHV